MKVGSGQQAEGQDGGRRGSSFIHSFIRREEDAGDNVRLWPQLEGTNHQEGEDTASSESKCQNSQVVCDGSSACGTYVANVWPVASVRSQNAVQHIVIRSALATSRDTTRFENVRLDLQLSGSTRLSLTCWKMHRLGKVREMSSLISSRLDSRSEEPASENASGKFTQAEGDERDVEPSCPVFPGKPSDSGSDGGAGEFFHFSFALARQMLYSSVQDTVQNTVSGSEL